MHMERTKRQANYELLRIIAMFMVVTLHYMNHTGMLLVQGSEASAVKVCGTLIESFSIVAVNVYVLISGYFLTEAGFKLKRIVVLLCQILFYAALIPLIMAGTGISLFSGENGSGIYGILPYIFPVQTEHYWFATSYVVMYLFSPVINAAVRGMSKRQLQVTLIGLLLLFGGIKSVIPVQFEADRFGYDFGWFLCVYLAAAYIRLHGGQIFCTAKRAWAVYAGCGLITFAFAAGLWYVNKATGALGYYMTVPFHYNYVLCFVGAVALFYAFRHIKIKPGKVSELICRISPLTFGVYLFHEHIDIRNEWAGWIEDYIGPVSGVGSLLLHWLISVILVYTAGIFIDALRLNIFSYIGRHIGRTRLAAWIHKIDGEFD